MSSEAGFDQLVLNFDRSGLTVLNLILAIVVFGIALGIKPDDFRRVAKVRRAFLLGIAAQFFLLPALTFLLIQVLRPAPSIALGMMLVAACPGGNISNFMTSFSRGNTALSVSMSAVSTLAAIIMTPLNLAFWGALDKGTAPILRTVSLDPLAIMGVVGLILGLPLILGMLTAHYFPGFAARAKAGFRWFSMAVFLLFVLGALLANLENFRLYIGLVASLVLVHNAVAFLSGFALARLGRLNAADTRAVTIEVGIQNSGLALVLIFDFFDALGGMALIAAWWGIWHIVSGTAIASWFRYRQPEIAQ
ncbi:MAG: bile acid:sodium symporter family protein [Pseudomonadota bacterium]